MSDTPKPRLGAGNIVVTLVRLDGGEPEEFVLKPSYQAARTLSAHAGGLGGVLERIGTIDVDLIAQIIALGAGYGVQGRRPPKDLAERVWATGLSDDSGGLAERCVLYVGTLMRGGQPPPQRDDDAPEVPQDPTPG